MFGDSEVSKDEEGDGQGRADGWSDTLEELRAHCSEERVN